MMLKIKKQLPLVLYAATVVIFLASFVETAYSDPTIVRAEAYGGDSVGVGKVVFRLDSNDKMAIQTNAVYVSSPDKRVFYPAFSLGLLEQLYSKQWTSASPAGGTHTVWFLFRGDEPINLTIHANGQASTQVDVNNRRPRIRNLMRLSWWRQYNAALRHSEKMGDVPPLASTYLKTMLQQRLGLNEPLVERLTESQSDPLQETLNLVFGGENTKTAAITEVMTRPSSDTSQVPIVQSPLWTTRSMPLVDDSVELEGIASTVPEECFYLRFGKWKNQLWLKSLMEEYAGDLSRMIALRGHEQPKSADFLSQLVLESSEMDDLLGGQLISDIAVIGLDMYFEDGAAVGIVLEAKGKLLNSNLSGKRKRYAEKNADKQVTLTEQKIASHTVTLLSSPNNLVRSFYVQDGDYHLITNSSELVKRFLQAGRGATPLSENPGFRYARSTFPLSRDDTVFIYASTPFFQNLMSPEYQIGVRRRQLETAAQQVCSMARWAAANEGLTDLSLSELSKYNFLRADNQYIKNAYPLVVDREAQIGDQVVHQLSVPIPDQNIQTITADEAAWYREHIGKITAQFKTFDPMLVAVKRYQLEKDIERVTFDARLAPFGQENYGWVGTVLGPPLDYEIASTPDDLVNVQMSVKGGMLRPDIGAHQIFGAIQNDAQTVELAPMTLMEWIKLFRSVPGYLGAWPKPGWLDVIPFGLGGRPDEHGYTKSVLTGLWRLQQGEFSVLSFDQHRLEELRPRLDVVEAKRNAQIRLRVGDVSQSNLAGWANRFSYQRTWQTSVANVRSANQLTQQFGVANQRALPAMESLVGLNLICPLGGEYQLVQNGADVQLQSSKWPTVVGSLPQDYQSPFLNWFKGVELEVTQVEGQFGVHGSLDILRHSQASMTLPSFNLFEGFPEIKSIGSKKQTKKDDR